MRTFAQKQNQPHRPASFDSGKFWPKAPLEIHQKSDFQSWRRTLGNQAAHLLHQVKDANLDRDSVPTSAGAVGHDFSRLPLDYQGAVQGPAKSFQVVSEPDGKPEGGENKGKEEELELELEGGKTEKIDLTKIKGELWWFNSEYDPLLAQVGKYLSEFTLLTGLPEGNFQWTVVKGADKVTFIEKGTEKGSLT